VHFVGFDWFIYKEVDMAKKGSPKKSPPPNASISEEVETFLAALEHPFKKEILILREILLGADPSISEGIKWNAPSFCTSEYFATFHLRAKEGLQIIFHFGAKKRDHSASEGTIPDPESLLEWLAKDRATIKFRDQKEIDAKRSAFEALVREWIQYV
jgi:hypothetical protein